MKKENILVIIVVVMVAAGALYYRNYQPSQTMPGTSVSSNKSGSGVSWSGYNEGMTTAKAADKPIFLYFHAPWCTYCKKLKKTTFQDKGVISHLKENFITISIDTDETPGIAREWGVNVLPTLWFVEPDGTRIVNIPGYLDAKKFKKLIEFISDEQYKTSKINEFIRAL